VIDGTFEGLLTALLEAYIRQTPPDAIEFAEDPQFGLFEERVMIATDPEKAERVWKGLKKHLGAKRRRKLYEAYLSGRAEAGTMIFQSVRDMIPGRRVRRTNAYLSAFIRIDKLALKVRREAHRMKGFIRFRQTGSGAYLALIAPRYDVLPLIRRHFESRFADQSWIIYDTCRDYGLCYDQNQTQELRFNTNALQKYDSGEPAGEALCQSLWQRYFAAVNIAQRNNPKLHLRQLPRRYWRYLPEKQT
jgi:probable DNA metabolism protein